MKDPNSAVSGRGLAQLRRAGVKVDVGFCGAEAKRLNEAFAKWIRTGLPFVTLKMAMTLDGKIAGPPSRRRVGTVTWITSPESRAQVQRMRHASDALLTGIGTVLADDPRLTDRTGLPRRLRLLRVVLDSHLRLPLRSKLVRSAAGDLLVFTAASAESPRARRLHNAGVEVIRVRRHADGLDLRDVLRKLGRRGVVHVLLEAGAKLDRAAVIAGVVDRFVHFVAPRVMGEGLGIEPPQVRFLNNPQLHGVTFRRCGPDFVVEGYLYNVYRNH
jgi:diaminohydroxyphosphoribosylaminopyrimidine deaminase/5-amino-6-(5-phosphoribosylamino)uracil reductase